jgi:hypothetical protein
LNAAWTRHPAGVAATHATQDDREAADPAASNTQHVREAGVTARSRRSRPSSVADRKSAAYSTERGKPTLEGPRSKRTCPLRYVGRTPRQIRSRCCFGRAASVSSSTRKTAPFARGKQSRRLFRPRRLRIVCCARGAACAARPGFGAVLGRPSQAPRSATVRGHGAADMLARNPRGEDTRWQSG